MANYFVQSAECTAGTKMIAACTAGAEFNMVERLSSRDRPSTGYYQPLHSLTTDIFYKTKTGKRRKPPEDIFYEVERAISRRVINRTIKRSISIFIILGHKFT